MRVLFVDDDAMNRRVVRDMLSVASVEMEEADSGAAGLAKVDAGDYDLILMDLRMPGMDGLTATRAIRARSDAKGGVPIIVVTADTARDLREQCLESGANDLVLKPVAMNGLFEAIGKVVVSRNQGDLLL